MTQRLGHAMHPPESLAVFHLITVYSSLLLQQKICYQLRTQATSLKAEYRRNECSQTSDIVIFIC